ncbi:hypothetical protein, partial [Vibrio sp. V37_P2S8PM304]|uniref:hypothetical protein n=1 Tax=Vibrio sp. V37_P2S8PM304 TaxID=1938688 RepID=UPI001F3A9E60
YHDDSFYVGINVIKNSNLILCLVGYPITIPHGHYRTFPPVVIDRDDHFCSFLNSALSFHLFYFENYIV